MPSKPDIWMPLYIGDYLADTSHLDAERHGCYLLWMMHYWRKGPLPTSIPDLVSIGRLRCKDAPSIAQALLDEFFTRNGDGRWHQKRLDSEILKWQDKSLKAKEKAKKGAEVRWGKDATSNATGNEQAVPETCPSPSPSPLSSSLPLPSKPPEEQKQKPSRVKRERPPTKTNVTTSRHGEFKAAIQAYWNAKNPGTEMPWDGAEGKQLEMYLGSSPTVTVEQFTGYLRNRFKSEVLHSERPSRWIGNVTTFANGPIDRFNKPLNGGNGNGRHSDTSKQARNIAAGEAVAAYYENLAGTNGNGSAEGRGMGSSLFGDSDGPIIEGAVRRPDDGHSGDC